MGHKDTEVVLFSNRAALTESLQPDSEHWTLLRDKGM